MLGLPSALLTTARLKTSRCDPLRGTERQTKPFPLGKKRGDTSGPGPDVICVCLPLATSSAQISKFLLMLKRTDSRSLVLLACTSSVAASCDHCGSPYQ